MSRLLIIDDDPNTLASLSRAFRMAGHEAEVADNAGRALALIRDHSFDLVFSDVVMPGKDGIALLEEIRGLGVSTPVVMMSGQATLDMAVRATRLGALDFLEKPLSTEKLLLTVENATRLARLEAENHELRKRVGRHEIVWASDSMRRAMSQVERVAAGESRVCILGETGTGKELIARAVHENSPRKNGPFVTVNCAAVPQELIESELFGHEKGAFTGAAIRHAGKFEQAHRGTLFLDEIGDMPAVMQAKLLRKSSAWAETALSASTSAWWWRRIAIWRSRSARARSARICIIASTSFPSSCLRFASGPAMSPFSSNISHAR